MPATDLPLPPIPDIPAASHPGDLAAAVAAELGEPPAPPSFAGSRLRTRPWFKQEQVEVAPPPAQVTAQTPVAAPTPSASLTSDFTPPPYPFPPRPAPSGDPVERTIALFDRIIVGRLLREYTGDALTEMVALREHFREEVATRPAPAGNAAA